MAETRKLIRKLDDRDSRALRLRERIINEKRTIMILLEQEKQIFLDLLLKKMGLPEEKKYFVDNESNLFEVLDDDKKEGK